MKKYTKIISIGDSCPGRCWRLNTNKIFSAKLWQFSYKCAQFLFVFNIDLLTVFSFFHIKSFFLKNCVRILLFRLSAKKCYSFWSSQSGICPLISAVTVSYTHLNLIPGIFLRYNAIKCQNICNNSLLFLAVFWPAKEQNLYWLCGRSILVPMGTISKNI